MAEAVLIAAQSGRALAEAARRAGMRPFVAVLFGDSDTLALSEAYRPLPGRFGSPMAFDATLAAIDALADTAGSVVGLVLGSGFEDAPDLMARIAERHRLIGAAAPAVAALKDPFALATLCARLDIPHPQDRDRCASRPVRMAAQAGRRQRRQSYTTGGARPRRRMRTISRPGSKAGPTR